MSFCPLSKMTVFPPSLGKVDFRKCDGNRLGLFGAPKRFLSWSMSLFWGDNRVILTCVGIVGVSRWIFINEGLGYTKFTHTLPKDRHLPLEVQQVNRRLTSPPRVKLVPEVTYKTWLFEDNHLSQR